MAERETEPLEALGQALLVTEERQQMLDLMGRRLTIHHSLTLHRDAASAADIRAMLDALTAAEMPDTATLRVDGSDNHTRMSARWDTEPGGAS